MGYGAFLKVVNNRATAIQTFVVNVECMYDQGQEGSELSLFNNAVIPASSSLPSGEKGQYIEVNASGSCNSSPSTFSLKIEDGSNHNVIGQVDFRERWSNWNLDNNDNKDVLDVYLNNSGQQAVMQLTVEAT